MRKKKMFETEWRLRPLISGKTTQDYQSRPKGTPYYEQVLLYDHLNSESGDWPFAIVHMDTFWTRHGDDQIYDSIKQGNDITVKVTFELVDENYPTDTPSTAEE